MINSDRSASSRSDEITQTRTVIKIPSAIRYLRGVSSRLLEGLASRKIGESRTFEIKLCVEEAVRNAIVHGNHFQESLSVTVSYWVEGDRLYVEVEDEGKGFDYNNIPDPTADKNMMKTSGRGVYLIRRLMDEARYSGNGNKVTMVKRLV